MKIRWFRDAINDLQELRDYIANDNSTAADQTAKRILKTVSILLEHPHIGRPGRVPATRELVVPGTPYVIPYRIKNDIIEILRVFHGAMLWPDEM